MTAYNESDAGRRQANEQVEITPGVPVDHVRWGPILAGTFAALTALAVLNTLGTAIGLSASDPGDDARRLAISAGIWGVISLVLSFALGGFLAGRSEALRGRGNGMLNGFMVAAVGIPLLMFMIASAAATAARNAPQDTSRTVAQSHGDGAMTASATMHGDSVTPASGSTMSTPAGSDQLNREDMRKTARNTAWGTLLGLVLALGAASMAGGMGANNDRHNDGDRAIRARNRDVTPSV